MPIIVYAIDENYVDYARISAKSVLKYNPDAFIVLVSEKPLSIGYEDKNVIIELPEKFRNRGDGDRITNTAYLKLFLTKLKYDKIIYLDGDTICQHPLNDLWSMDIEYIGLTESHDYGKKQAKALGLAKYGLSGMMVMNLSNLRKVFFTKRCLAVQNRKIPDNLWQHDETCINLGVPELLTFIDKKWNYCRNRIYSDGIPESEACILHYVGKQKEDMLEEEHYGKLREVLKYIKGKSVAIVGNAKSIFNTHYGAEIDSHDIVIRFNKGFVYYLESQGKRTDILLLACLLREDERLGYGAKYVINRSKDYRNQADFTISNKDRERLKNILGSQPSTGFMAIDLCLEARAGSIDLYGFDFEETPTFYNPGDYHTKHDYPKEREIVLSYQEKGLLTIHTSPTPPFSIG